MTGTIFDIKRFSIHDGPGIRTTVFFKGCALSCRWCQNPESISPEPEEMFRESRCIHCGKCSEGCFSGARETVGWKITAGDLLEQLLRDREFYRESGGGVTFSGGEPLLQHEFLTEVLSLSREQGLHTAVDTCGAVSREAFERTAGITDLYLFDIKHVNDAIHREFTGAGCSRIIENLRFLLLGGSRIEVRIPVVAGFNDDRESMESISSMLACLPEPVRVELLRCHDLAGEKYKGLGKRAGCYVPEMGKMEEFSAVLRKAGISLTGGYR